MVKKAVGLTPAIAHSVYTSRLAAAGGARALCEWAPVSSEIIGLGITTVIESTKPECSSNVEIKIELSMHRCVQDVHNLHASDPAAFRLLALVATTMFIRAAVINNRTVPNQNLQD
jgi:hypothetical protein